MVHLKRLLPILPQLREIFKSHPDRGGMILNTCLVWAGARKAYFPEGMNDETMAILKPIFDLMNSTPFKPKIKYREFNSYIALVYTNPALDKVTDMDTRTLGKWLGFYCVGHKYDDSTQDRIGLNFATQDYQIRAEYCSASHKNVTRQMAQLKRYAVKVAQQFNEVTELFGQLVRFKLTLDLGTNSKNDNFNNDVFVRQHFQEYVNDIFNDWSAHTKMPDSYDEAKAKDWLQLFKFEYWVGTMLDIFNGMYAPIGLFAPGDDEKMTNKKTKVIDDMQKDMANFEKDLSKSQTLLVRPYNTWVGTREFQQILRRQPKFIQNPFKQSFQ
jgi:hypothetical protein